MAFLRFSRDKRGYEHFYLVEATTNRRGKTRARVLYWFRTPPGVKVGREPFDDDVRQALEAQNPGVVFDWRKIVETPIPSADAERWRERRRAEKAEKAARRARSSDSGDDAATDEEPDAAEDGDEETGAPVNQNAPETSVVESPVPAAPTEPRRSRRRRRKRGSKGSSGSEGSSGSTSSSGSDSIELQPLEPVEPLEPLEPQEG